MPHVFMRTAFLRLIAAAILVLSTVPALASHIMGGSITWQCNSNGEVQFELVLYQDCRGFDLLSLDPTQVLRVFNHPTISQITVNFSAKEDISPSCAGGAGPNCSFDHFGAVERFTYVSSPIDMGTTPPPANGWIITQDDCCRNNTISNVQNPGGTGTTFRAVMYDSGGSSPCADSSPTFTSTPQMTYCVGMPHTVSNVASDADLDSLAFSLASAIDDFQGSYSYPVNPGPVTYASPYSASHPIPGLIGIDAHTGQLSFNTTQQGEYVVVVKCESWRNGTLVSEVYHEYAIMTTVCTTGTAPSLSTNLTAGAGGYYDTLTVGETGLYTLQGTSIAQSVQVAAEGGWFSANFANPNSCDLPPCALLAPPPIAGFFQGDSATAFLQVAPQLSNLTTASGFLDSYTYLLEVKFLDDVCPLPREVSATIAITVELPACAAPSGLQHGFLQDTSAGIAWDPIATATAWRIRYTKVGSGVLQTQLKSGSQTTATISGLDPGSKYRWSVQANCNGSWGPISALDEFWTLAQPCINPTALGQSPIGTTVARLNWTPQTGTVKHRLQWRASGGGSWNTLVKSNPATGHHWLTGLSAGTAYEWRIKAVCQYGPSTGNHWTATQQFTTATNKWALNDSGNEALFQPLVFPNPAADKVTISGLIPGTTSTLVLRNALGSAVLEHTTQNDQLTLQLPEIAPGIYLLEVAADGFKVHQRLVIE